ncbi:hypothetical protein HZI31_08015 [Serratia fonticola]|jgi:hypothetical protein|uniref:hypothetical protein n=1 Tax=Serratia fonticola TaxID=47917 RepID=UPI0015C5B7DF|nr:hypothetical protein [Serratia fonticola]NYA43247.1 hypothetical protein [Serratia fonticola]
MSYAITKISRRSSRYRGFVITHRPRTVTNPIPRYEITLGDLSFGLFDAQALATGYIDQLHTEHEAAA